MKTFKNPYRVGSSYWTITEILATQLGKMMPADQIIKAFPKTMGDGFKRFKSKKPRNKETAQDVNGKIIANATVICRTDRYGIPAEVGYQVRKEHTKESGYSFGLFPLAKSKKAAK